MSRRLRRSRSTPWAYRRPEQPETGVSSETRLYNAHRIVPRLGGADAIDQGFGLRRPFVLHAQIRQRRFRQGVERAPTGFAAVARQSARLAPTYDVAVVAVRATNAVHPALPEVSDTGRLERRRWPCLMRRACRLRCRRRQIETADALVHGRARLDVYAVRGFGYASACQACRRCGSVNALISPSQVSNAVGSMLPILVGGPS